MASKNIIEDTPPPYSEKIADLENLPPILSMLPQLAISSTPPTGEEGQRQINRGRFGSGFFSKFRTRSKSESDRANITDVERQLRIGEGMGTGDVPGFLGADLTQGRKPQMFTNDNAQVILGPSVVSSNDITKLGQETSYPRLNMQSMVSNVTNPAVLEKQSDRPQQEANNPLFSYASHTLSPGQQRPHLEYSRHPNEAQLLPPFSRTLGVPMGALSPPDEAFSRIREVERTNLGARPKLIHQPSQAQFPQSSRGIEAGQAQYPRREAPHKDERRWEYFNQNNIRPEAVNLNERVRAQGAGDIGSFEHEFNQLGVNSLERAINLGHCRETNQRILNDPDVQATNNSTMGPMLFQNWINTRLIRGGDISHSAIFAFCRHYAAKLREETLKKVELYDEWKGYFRDMIRDSEEKQSEKNKEICKDKLFYCPSSICGIDIPTYFAPTNVVVTTQDRSYLKNCFPLAKKWVGVGKGVTIQSWLSEFTVGQNLAKLSKPEFFQMLISCTDGEANHSMQEAVERHRDDKDVRALYSEIIRAYDEMISPAEAKLRLESYRACKGKNLVTIQNDLLRLASRASLIYEGKAVRNDFIVLETPVVLIKCLPTEASGKAQIKFNDLQRELLARPKFLEFTRALRSQEDYYNKQIDQHGIPPSQAGKSSIYIDTCTFNPNYRKYKDSNGASSNGHRRGFRGNVSVVHDSSSKQHEVRGHINQIESKDKRTDYKLDSGNNRRSCLLCGLFNHSEADTCKSQFTDSGEIVKQNSPSLPCKDCLETLGKELRHVKRYCPIRPRALELYREKTITPIGHFKAYCIKNNIGDYEFHKNKSSPNMKRGRGRVNIISVSKLVDEARSEKIPFDAFTIDTRKDLFTAKLYLDLEAELPAKGQRQVSALLDSGADSCLMTKSYFGMIYELFEEVECYVNNSDTQLSSFTNHPIHVVGEVNLNITIPFSGGKTMPIKFVIIDDYDKDITPMIISLKALGDLELNLEHKRVESGENMPIIYSSGDPKRLPLSQYLTDDEVNMVYGVATRLEPGECKHFEFYIDHFFGFSENTDVLITEDFIPPQVNNSFIQIIATKSLLVYDHYRKRLKGIGFVKNNGKNTFHNMPVVGRIENACYYRTGQIDLSNFNTIVRKPFILDSPTATAEDFRVGNLADSIRINKISKSHKNINIIQADSMDTFCIIPQKCLKISNYFPENKEIRPVSNSINNGMGDVKQSLTESRVTVKESDGKLSKEDIESFNDPEQAGQLGIKTFKEDEDFLKVVKHQRGYELPDKYSDATLEEIIYLDKYPKEIKAFVKELFIDKYPELIATSSLQKGGMSETLGKYKVRLRDNVNLPRHKKVYYLAPLETQQLQAILEFLIQDGTLEKANQQGDLYNEFSSPGYLIPRSSPDSSPRLIVNFTHLNSLIAAEPAVLPTVDSMINKLRDAYFFSVVDLANAFYSIDITEDSKPLTVFTCSLGSFQHCKLPTGLRTSPEALNRFVAKAIHYEPVFDKDGNKQWEEDGTLKMRYDPNPNALFIYDDVLLYSEPKETYKESLKAHYDVLAGVMKRLHFHKCKLSIHKSQLFKTKINFFGYFIQNKHVFADPKRIQKVLDTPEPTTPTELRSFLGLINSMRGQLGFHTLKHFGLLTELTNGKLRSFALNTEQKGAFNSIKESLTKGPIYSQIIDPMAPKVIFSDMSGSTNACYSAVLAQVVYPKPGQSIVPVNLNLLDKCHAVLYDQKIMAMPLPLKNKDQLLKNYIKNVSNNPPDFSYLDSPFLGYSESEASNSLGISLKLILEVSNCSIKFSELCKTISKHIRSSVQRYNFVDFIFDGDVRKFDNYIKNLEGGKFMIDKKLFIFEAIAESLFRPVAVVSSIEEFPDISEFNTVKTKAPIYMLLYKVNDMYIVRPGIADKEASYRLANLRGTLEILSYASKTIHQKEEHLHILDLELQAILFAIESFRKVCGSAPTLLLTDSQPLFHLFNSINLNGNKKISRWNYRLLQALPQLVIKHVISAENISDFLTRQYKVDKPNLPKLQLSRFNTEDYNNLVPDITFDLKSWAEFVEKHKNFIFTTSTKAKPNNVKMGHIKRVKFTPELKSISTVLTPIQVLKDRISTSEIVKFQLIQFKDLIDSCNIADRQRITRNGKIYFLNKGTLCIKLNDTNKLMCPDVMLPLFISYSHVTSLHSGEGRMRLALQHLYHKDLLKMIRIYTKSCYGCAISQTSTHLNKLGLYPMVPRAFFTVSLDYIQDLPPFRGYKHVLVVTCHLTGAIYAYPTTTLTSKEFLRIYLFNVHQLLSPKQILSDNATTFINKDVVVELGALGVKVIPTTSHNPRGKGTVERANYTLKLALMKIIGNKKNYNWMYSLPVICQQYNITKSNKHGLPPMDLLFGQGASADHGHFNMLPEEDVHPILGSEINAIKKRHEEINSHLSVVKEKVQNDRIERLKQINKTRLDKNFQVDDLVLIKNFGYTPGVKVGLRAPYHHSPYRVLETFSVSILGLRLTDNHVIKVHANDAKHLHQVNDKFKDIPKEVLTVMKTPMHELTDKQIADLILNDDFELPKSILEKYESYAIDDGIEDSNTNELIENNDETNTHEANDDFEDEVLTDNVKEVTHYNLRPKKRVHYAK